MRQLIAALVMLLLTRPALAARTVSVHLFSLSPISRLRIVAAPPATVEVDQQRTQHADTAVLDLSAHGTNIDVGHRLARTVTVMSPHLELNGRVFAGRVTIRCPAGSLYCVGALPFEDYVAGVVASEALPNTPPAALQALAVCARSYATAHRPHADEGYDFCDSTHCQDFHGLAAPDSAAWAATRVTAGQIMTLGGRPLTTYYHSTCGGRTAGADEVFAAGAGLTSVVDGTPAWCARSPHFAWNVRVPAVALCQALDHDRATAVGAVLSDVRVLRRGPSGRALSVELRGSRTVRVGAYDLWLVLGRTLGWGQVESTWFHVKRDGNAFVFEGHGLGHGLGLCQWGSAEMARRGRNMKQILAHYFPDARLQK